MNHETANADSDTNRAGDPEHAVSGRWAALIPILAPLALFALVLLIWNAIARSQYEGISPTVKPASVDVELTQYMGALHDQILVAQNDGRFNTSVLEDLMTGIGAIPVDGANERPEFHGWRWVLFSNESGRTYVIRDSETEWATVTTGKPSWRKAISTSSKVSDGAPDGSASGEYHVVGFDMTRESQPESPQGLSEFMKEAYKQGLIDRDPTSVKTGRNTDLDHSRSLSVETATVPVTD